jgi:hypothetical protein
MRFQKSLKIRPFFFLSKNTFKFLFLNIIKKERRKNLLVACEATELSGARNNSHNSPENINWDMVHAG